MPRDIPVGNGQMLVTFDELYRVRDLYYPHVGQENHAGAGPCRFGVWSTLSPDPSAKNDRRKQRMVWTDDPEWDIQRHYVQDTLSTDVTLTHPRLGVRLNCQDVVDFHRPVHVRRIEVHNQTDQPKDVRLVHHQDFHMYGTRVGDTAYYDPALKSLVHYRKKRYILASFYQGSQHQIDQYATGNAGFHGAEGTWRDAEDGELGNNPIAQGAVDSTMLTKVNLAPGESKTVYMVIGCGKKIKDMKEIHRFLHRVAVGHVRGQRQRLAPGRLHGGHGIRQRLDAAAHARDVEPVRGQPLRDGPADVLRGSRHQGDAHATPPPAAARTASTWSGLPTLWHFAERSMDRISPRSTLPAPIS